MLCPRCKHRVLERCGRPIMNLGIEPTGKSVALAPQPIWLYDSGRLRKRTRGEQNCEVERRVAVGLLLAMVIAISSAVSCKMALASE
jgi:hypothetical protein